MDRYITLILALLLTVSTQAQKRISREYNNVSLSDALKQLSEQQTGYTIYFLYNELEDFRITTTVKNKGLPEAIHQMIGFYPIRVTTSTDEDGKKIYVECTHKTDLHLTGTIIDEQGQPVAYANIAILNPADSTLLCGYSLRTKTSPCKNIFCRLQDDLQAMQQCRTRYYTDAARNTNAERSDSER